MAREALDARHLGDWLATSGLRVALIVAGCVLATRFAWLLIRRVERAVREKAGDRSERLKRAHTIGQALRSLFGGIFLFLGLALVLREFGVDIGPIVAGAGVAGLAIGFGAQTLVRDVIAGVFILYENQFDIGDTVSGAGVQGVVESMNLRTTVLRDPEGRIHVIPNGELKVITNMTRGWNAAIVDVGVAYTESLEGALACLREEMQALAAEPGVREKLLGPIEIVGLEDFREHDYTLRVQVRTQPLAHVAVRRAIRARALGAFQKRDIRMRAEARA